ncbi:hypothetical protein V9T40_001639 [Parthenolecanium corni]|uniref:Uncharacterized protein n=1 Tax=Parthenolecanium corni TaxID=536013 RepID=A0AAN9TKK7_9HEMI
MGKRSESHPPLCGGHPEKLQRWVDRWDEAGDPTKLKNGKSLGYGIKPDRLTETVVKDKLVSLFCNFTIVDDAIKFGTDTTAASSSTNSSDDL